VVKKLKKMDGVVSVPVLATNWDRGSNANIEAELDCKVASSEGTSLAEDSDDDLWTISTTSLAFLTQTKGKQYTPSKKKETIHVCIVQYCS
jgi:hypothetical protein